jgi:hypothetical protein
MGKRARSARPSSHGKLTVIYDEAARKDFITGFRKRKDARRRDALEREAALQKEAHKQARAESRRAVLEAAGAAGCGIPRVEVVPEVEAPAAEAFADDSFSRRMFGSGEVLVFTSALGAGAGAGEGEAVAAALAEESRERLRELAAPALAEARARREAEAEAAVARERSFLAKRVKNRKALKNAAFRDRKEVRGGGGSKAKKKK